jgi:hypothetical protein
MPPEDRQSNPTSGPSENEQSLPTFVTPIGVRKMSISSPALYDLGPKICLLNVVTCMPPGALQDKPELIVPIPVGYPSLSRHCNCRFAAAASAITSGVSSPRKSSGLATDAGPFLATWV